jgi:rSAM/selenodomain-associated transferase 1
VALIQIFAKPPIAGKVKTRLIPDLGESVATEIYRYCLDYTLNLVRQSELDYQIWLSEDSNDPIFQGEAYSLQQGSDLGSRMLQAISSQLQQATSDIAKVILIGSDCLDITSHHLHQAAEALDGHDIALLPALDGGYALIACRKIEAPLFADVEWGTGNVFEQTLKNAKFLNYRVSILETVRDIDTLQDVNHYAELKPLLNAI